MIILGKVKKNLIKWQWQPVWLDTSWLNWCDLYINIWEAIGEFSILVRIINIIKLVKTAIDKQ